VYSASVLTFFKMPVLHGQLLQKGCRAAALPEILGGKKIKLHICIKVIIKSPNENFYSEKLFRLYQNFWKGCSPTTLIQEPLLLPNNPSDDTAVRNENHRPLTDTKKIHSTKL
jgi:hypothetical protein